MLRHQNTAASLFVQTQMCGFSSFRKRLGLYSYKLTKT